MVCEHRVMSKWRYWWSQPITTRNSHTSRQQCFPSFKKLVNMLHSSRTDMSSLAHPRHRLMAHGYIWLNQRPTSLRERAKDDRSASSGTDQSDRQGLWEPLAGIHLLLLRYNVCFPTALVSQPQLWHQLPSVRTARGRPALHVSQRRWYKLSICGKPAIIMRQEFGCITDKRTPVTEG